MKDQQPLSASSTDFWIQKQAKSRIVVHLEKCNLNRSKTWQSVNCPRWSNRRKKDMVSHSTVLRTIRTLPRWISSRCMAKVLVSRIHQQLIFTRTRKVATTWYISRRWVPSTREAHRPSSLTHTDISCFNEEYNMLRTSHLLAQERILSVVVRKQCMDWMTRTLTLNLIFTVNSETHIQTSSMEHINERLATFQGSQVANTSPLYSTSSSSHRNKVTTGMERRTICWTTCTVEEPKETTNTQQVWTQPIQMASVAVTHSAGKQ